MDFTPTSEVKVVGGWNVPHLFSQEMIEDSAAIRHLFATTSLVDSLWLSWALGDTYEPALTMADEVALLELGPLDTSDQPERVVHDDCWTCDCYGWGW